MNAQLLPEVGGVDVGGCGNAEDAGVLAPAHAPDVQIDDVCLNRAALVDFRHQGNVHFRVEQDAPRVRSNP